MSRKHASKSTTHPGHKARQRHLTWLWIGLAVLLIVVVGFLMLSSKTAYPAGVSPTKTAVSVEISAAQAYAKYLQGALFLDVRSQAEWDQFHIKGSILIPLDELSDRLTELPQDKDIVVICLSGHRALSGTVILQQAGFKRVSCLTGGLQAWKDANYPIENGTP